MTQILVKFSANWANEISLNGWELYSRLAWGNVETAILGHKYPTTTYVGSNQDITFNSAKELLDAYTVEQISDEDAEILKRLFPSGERGTFKAPWEYWDDDLPDPRD